MLLATSSTNYDVAYDVTCLALWRWINCYLSGSPDDFRSFRLIQVFCHKYSFVLFYIIVIRLEAWLTNWLTVNLLKKNKIKRKITFFFSKYQIYFISWVENIEIFIRAAHSWKFLYFQHTRWNIFGIHLKKVNILYMYLLRGVILLPGETSCDKHFIEMNDIIILFALLSNNSINRRVGDWRLSIPFKTQDINYIIESFSTIQVKQRLKNKKK